MDDMFNIIDEMMDKMGGEDRMKLMTKVMQKCMQGMSPEQCAGAVKDVFPGGESKDDAAWAQMPNMIMSMMGMMCVKMMSDMAGEKPAGAGTGGGPGFMNGMMGGGGPMKMMQRMMQNFGTQQAGATGEAKPGDTCDSSEKSGDSG